MSDTQMSQPVGVLDAKLPSGPIEDRWDNHKFSMRLVNPNNKRRFEVIVIDDRSTDEGPRVVRSIMDERPDAAIMLLAAKAAPVL